MLFVHVHVFTLRCLYLYGVQYFFYHIFSVFVSISYAIKNWCDVKKLIRIHAIWQPLKPISKTYLNQIMWLAIVERLKISISYLQNSIKTSLVEDILRVISATMSELIMKDGNTPYTVLFLKSHEELCVEWIGGT